MDDGLVIWACEGSKTAHFVEVVNSSKGIIQIFLKWLRTKQNIDETRLRLRIDTHQSNIEQEKKYWSTVTGIPINQFLKPLIDIDDRKKKGKTSVAIRYNSRPLTRKIRNLAIKKGLLDESYSKYNHKGTTPTKH